MAASPTDLLQEGLALHRRGAVAEAAARYAQVLQTDPANADAHYYLGMLACQQGRFAEGAARADRALAGDPRHRRAHVLMGRALNALGRREEALESFDRAIVIAPDFAQAHGHRADLLSELGRYPEAIASYDKCLALAPESAGDWFNRGTALVEAGRQLEALASFERAIGCRPDLDQAHLRRAKLLLDLDRGGEALAVIDNLLRREPNSAEAWLGRGNVLHQLKRRDQAADAFARAVALKPDLAEAWFGRGIVLFDATQYAEAIAAYDKALALKPDMSDAASFRVLAKLYICNWTSLDEDIARLVEKIRDPEHAVSIYPMLSLPLSAADQLKCARLQYVERPNFPALYQGQAYSHQRIRIAYLSADFHEHPNGYLTAGLFERHDRARFEVTGISFGPDQDSPVRQRIKSAFDRFIDVRDKSDQEVAELLGRLEIDIAVDLMGFTLNNRLNIFGRRPAPIQVNYLGYIGTLGARFIDYVIADSIALPFDQQPYFDERIVHLPDCFLLTDDRQEIADVTPSRQEAGLPAEGFVFCSFNNSYKLMRPVFGAWMRILRAVPGSVLWLARANAEMVDNLRRQAQRLQVNPARIVFAPRLSLPQHLARQRLADLFLDTVPYNAGATAVGALWSGVPVLTIRGETFVGRMAASIVHAIDLPELVTDKLEDYEALAIKLASEPKLLGGLRRRLEENKRQKPLFDTDRFRRHLEEAYITMVELHQRGEAPRSFSVDAVTA